MSPSCGTQAKLRYSMSLERIWLLVIKVWLFYHWQFFFSLSDNITVYNRVSKDTHNPPFFCNTPPFVYCHWHSLEFLIVVLFSTSWIQLVIVTCSNTYLKNPFFQVIFFNPRLFHLWTGLQVWALNHEDSWAIPGHGGYTSCVHQNPADFSICFQFHCWFTSVGVLLLQQFTTLEWNVY